ncbi:Gfo/Idh/MocA family oxidoreductase [Streptosporangium sp. NBC_01755]|uniref:Gfo/Idh/MocA family protein n=1 Tax=Streptosporangium sp. NBC_01755 TaxID=2975949 RepID=UPI002DDBEFDC|nr:Gfo/Idh/MocA family oxidoreductase [Streptosporangium sp. NBC_01755]WSD00678.1 Gfo/Idh/MocA family oxidoreductase [Streptosporangium sp. NBC_01755]
MTIRVGMVGAGQRASEVHAPALAACAETEFAGVWARSHGASAELAARYRARAFESYHDLLEECDAVALAVPPAAQAELGAHAAHARKAVLLEKPIAGDIAGAENLLMAVDRGGAVSQVALVWRHAPAIQRFLDAAERTWPVGGSGLAISGTQTDESSASPWRLERSVVLELGPDLVDLLEAALGRVVDVRAQGDPSGWFGLLLEHEGGRFSQASLYARAVIDPPRAEVEIYGPGGATSIDCVAAVGREAYEAMYRDFAGAVERGTPPPTDVRHGLHLQQVIEAAETDLIRSGPSTIAP